jgi:hypothetical protein
MRTSAGFHADPLNAAVPRKSQQLLTREAFANHDLAALVETR